MSEEGMRPQLREDIYSFRERRRLTSQQKKEIGSAVRGQLQEDLCVGIIGYVPLHSTRRYYRASESNTD